MSPKQLADRLVSIVDTTVSDDGWLASIRSANDAGEYHYAIVDAVDALIEAKYVFPADLRDALDSYRRTLDAKQRKQVHTPLVAA